MKATATSQNSSKESKPKDHTASNNRRLRTPRELAADEGLKGPMIAAW
ncbi:MAG: hypothetical protein IPG22_08900 [Acidobacteria bacterium]|nr:hypothetical protein [Acidobacteriota bacterium]